METARTDDPLIWLEKHGIRCERYRATMSPSACRSHQAWDPDACHKCRRARSPRARGGWGTPRAELLPVIEPDLVARV